MSKLTKSARDEECQIRIPGVCNRKNETTVLAHLEGGGMGGKMNDIHGAYACSDCHDSVDFRVACSLEPEILKLYHLEGVIRTQQVMLRKGLIST